MDKREMLNDFGDIMGGVTEIANILRTEVGQKTQGLRECGLFNIIQKLEHINYKVTALQDRLI